MHVISDMLGRIGKAGIGFIVLLVVIIISLLSYSDRSASLSAHDGLVVTDKTGKSYMLQEHYGSGYSIREFDVDRMKLK